MNIRRFVITALKSFRQIHDESMPDTYTKAQTDERIAAALKAKQDTLVSGTNIKTVNNRSLLGGGDITIGGSGGGGVDFGVASVSGGGGTETSAVIEKGEDSMRVSFVKSNDPSVPINYVNLGIAGENLAFATAAHVGDQLDGKQARLESGVNIRTVNGNSLLGSGNLDVGETNFEVGAEKWCGTYKEEGVTYQVYSNIVKIDALPSAAGITNYPHGITGIKQILSAYGFTTDGFVLNAPRQNAQDNIAIYQVGKSASSGSIAIEVGKDRSSKQAYVCLVYAKNN